MTVRVLLAELLPVGVAELLPDHGVTPDRSLQAQRNIFLRLPKGEADPLQPGRDVDRAPRHLPAESCPWRHEWVRIGRVPSSIVEQALVILKGPP